MCQYLAQPASIELSDHRQELAVWAVPVNSRRIRDRLIDDIEPVVTNPPANCQQSHRTAGDENHNF
jgi:hypothetical protein